MSPLDALPVHLQDSDAWKGTDDDNWLMRWRLKCKGWFAYGPRASKWWAKWREIPVCLFKIGGLGYWRWELDGQGEAIVREPGDYLSRIQYWKRWHIQVQWPFFIAFHFYFKADDVPCPWNEWDTDGMLIYGYFGAHRDADKVYWFPSAYLGRNWK